jgi:phage tail-like protein
VADKSSYLKYLPPVLWEDEPPAPAFSLGAVLRIFEKVLTGIDDDVEVRHRGHVHPPLTTEIARLERLFDPWKTPESFLPWLASWVALEFPTLQDLPLWDEYQQRKVTSEIAQIYRQRGLKAGLNQYLELYAVGKTRPRVAVDDGSRLLLVTSRPGALAPVAGLVTQGPVVTRDGVRSDGLIRPRCLAAAPDGTLFVGDLGVPEVVPVPLRSRVWRISADGHYDLAGAPPKPQPLDTTALPAAALAAVAVRRAQAGRPETLYVLNQAGGLFAIPSPYRDAPAALVTSLVAAGATFAPVAMAVDLNGDLLVLDRGDGVGTPNPPKVVAVQPDPLRVTRTPLRKVTEPLSLLVQPDGRLIVGDGGVQEPTAPAQFPGNLVRVDRGAATWTETTLLAAANPLVAPTGLARTGDGRLHVLDAGLKPFAPSTTDPFVCAVAEPAAVFRVDPDVTPPTVTRVTQGGQFVYPTGLVATGQRLVACDPGQPPVAGLQPFMSRLRPFQFDVVIHFADSRLSPDPAVRAGELSRAVGNIRTIVGQQKPAHTLWNLVTAI